MSENETFICQCCGHEHPMGERTMFQHTALCQSCYEDETTVCDNCGERIWVDDSVRDDYTEVCQSCYENYFTRCEHCDRLIRYTEVIYLDGNEDEPYCSDCAERIGSSRNFIQSYYFKPVPIFHGNGTRFLGVELEIDWGGECHNNAANLMDIANASVNNLYVKHDGSLDEGMELVTHPMTLDYHMNEMPWKAVMREAVQMGYRSHQTSTCGLHIHVNRDSFGKTEKEQEAVIAKILFFVENCWNEFLRFSRRTQAQMEQWAARYGRKNSPKEQMDHVKKAYAGRYTCVNLTNANTIEFRMFRGTLRYNTLIATLQLISELCNMALCLSDDEMGRLTWTEFVARVGNLNYPELVQYLKERRLYVSEAVVGEEEL